MGFTEDRGAVEWLPWCSESFARARAEQKPILLSIVATWARGCAEMDRVSYGDRATAQLINASVVAVRIDADERPDLADRYDLGGLPTTAFLTADGELLGGGTFVSAPRLCAAVSKAASAVSRGTTSVLRAPSPGTTTTEQLLASVFGAFDDRHAGFGTAPKFPLTAPVRLAIDLYAQGDAPEMLDPAVRTLDAVGWGPLYDEEHGGFFRCASHADWTDPQPEKLLATNAALLDLYLHAGQVLGHDRWFARAADVVHYLNRALSTGGPWRISECADPARQFTDSNALTVSAMLHAAAVFQDDALGKRTLDAFERVLLPAYKPGEGVAHHANGVRGLLGDQVAIATASLDAWEATGNIVYRMMAEELMHYTLRTMWDTAGGGCFDHAVDAEGSGPLGGSARPFVLNCDAAIVLRRLAEAVNDAAFGQRAVEALDAMSSRAPEFGPLAAHYLLAERAVRR
jgi:uncharacterized protein YyaL (SSP411 family)